MSDIKRFNDLIANGVFSNSDVSEMIIGMKKLKDRVRKDSLKNFAIGDRVREVYMGRNGPYTSTGYVTGLTKLKVSVNFISRWRGSDDSTTSINNKTHVFPEKLDKV